MKSVLAPSTEWFVESKSLRLAAPYGCFLCEPLTNWTQPDFDYEAPGCLSCWWPWGASCAAAQPGCHFLVLAMSWRCWRDGDDSVHLAHDLCGFVRAAVNSFTYLRWHLAIHDSHIAGEHCELVCRFCHELSFQPGFLRSFLDFDEVWAGGRYREWLLCPPRRFHSF